MLHFVFVLQAKFAQVIEAIIGTFQAIACELRPLPDFLDDVIFVAAWALIISCHHHLNEWLGLNALQVRVQIISVSDLEVGNGVPPTV